MPLWMLPLLAASIAIVIVAIIHWREIFAWVQQMINVVPNASHVDIIKKRLASGEYRVVTGIFGPGVFGIGDKMKEGKAWQSKQVDDETIRQFGDQEFITMPVTRG